MNTNTYLKIKEKHKTINFGDYSIHYFVSGEENSESILFLHPAFSDHRAFRFQLEFFSEKFKVITLDLIGHGLSQVSSSSDKLDQSSIHIEKILEEEGVKSIHIVGVSMGSLIAQYFGYKNPEMVKSLTLVGGYNIHKKNNEIGRAQFTANLTLFLRAIFSIDMLRKKVAEISTYTAEGFNLFYDSSELYQRKSFKVMQGLGEVIKNRETIIIPFPMLIMVGEHDLEIILKVNRKWKEELVNSNLRLIEGAGHCINMDLPDVFNKVLYDFIKKD